MTSGPSQSMNLGGLPSPYNDSFVALDLMKGAEGWRGLDDNLINPASLSFDARGCRYGRAVHVDVHPDFSDCCHVVVVYFDVWYCNGISDHDPAVWGGERR